MKCNICSQREAPANRRYHATSDGTPPQPPSWRHLPQSQETPIPPPSQRHRLPFPAHRQHCALKMMLRMSSPRLPPVTSSFPARLPVPKLKSCFRAVNKELFMRTRFLSCVHTRRILIPAKTRSTQRQHSIPLLAPTHLLKQPTFSAGKAQAKAKERQNSVLTGLGSVYFLHQQRPLPLPAPISADAEHGPEIRGG